MKMPQVKMPEVTTTGRDLLSESESKVPDSPVIGGKDEDLTKRRGISALKINKTSTGNSKIFDPVNRGF